MKHIVFILTLGALVLITAGVAVAKEFNCNNTRPNACSGTPDRDIIHGNNQPN